MTTISHVRECTPRSMVDAAQDLITQNDTFSSRVTQMNRDVDTAMNTWKGDAATAASARALSHELAGNHIGETVVTIADHLDAYGNDMDGYRTALVTIVEHEMAGTGMTVDDNGNVTAPKLPDTDWSVIAMVLQQQLDDEAAGFQTRIKNLLTQFGDAETTAAQAITDDLRALAGYEKTPDGPPPRSQVQDILAGRAQLPTDPKQLHDFWETLTPAEKDALWQHDQYLGNHDGLPAVDRDHYNRLKLADELARAQNGDPTVKDNLGDLQTVAAQVNQPERYLLQLDTQSGAQPHAAIAIGNPDTADHVATYVPGTGSRPSKMEADMVRAEAMRYQAAYGGAANPSVVAWFGYDSPPELPDATLKSYADNAASSLDHFQDGLRASHDGARSYNTVIGHSYGTTVIGVAAAQGHSLNADAAVLVASPGTTVEHAGDLHLTGVPPNDVQNHVFATQAEHDLVPLYGETGLGGWLSPQANVDDLGPDPADSDFGGRVFQSDPGTAGPGGGYSLAAHSQYWTPGCKSLRGMGDIIAGHGDAAVAIK